MVDQSTVDEITSIPRFFNEMSQVQRPSSFFTSYYVQEPQFLANVKL